MEKLDKRNIEDVFALTPMQEGMLFHYLKDPNSDYYFEQLSLEISGKIDTGIFEKSWNFVIETNEMLRTVFRWEKVENPIQIILKKHQLQLRYHDLAGEEGTKKKTQVERIKVKDRREKFNLQEVPFRVTLCKVREDRYVMMISNHHILYDGWSSGIILKEFFKTYDDLAKGKESVKPVKPKFKEFVKKIQDQDKEKQEKLWREYLRGFDTQTELSVKKRKSRELTSTAADSFRVTVTLPGGLKDKIEDFVKSYKITLAVLFYSTWGILLQRYNNSEDVIFGTTVSGRNVKLQGIEDIAGLFINTLPLRIQINANEKIGAFLYRIDKELQRRESFETNALVNIKGYSENDNKEELFDSIVVIESYPLDSRLMLKNTNLSVVSYSMVERPHYDLNFIIEIFGGIDCVFIYNKGRFDEEDIERLSCHLRCVLRNVINNPVKKLIDIEIISEQEKNKILYEFNNTETDFPRNKTINQLVGEQVERTPDNRALIGGWQSAVNKGTTFLGCKDNTLITYKELNKRTRQLAQGLREKGVLTDDIVGIMMERSLDMMIGILGILKAGGAYLPIDPGYPGERIEFMKADSGANVLLTTGTLAKEGEKIFPDEFVNKISVPSVSSPVKKSPGTGNLRPAASLAYVIYTSGSTGKPKGVMVEHHSVVNRLKWMQKKYPLEKDDLILQKTSITFDVSVWELFWWAWEGASLCLLPPGGEKDPTIMVEAIEKHIVTTMHFVPSMLQLMLEYIENEEVGPRLKSLKQVFCSGEALGPHHVKTFNKLLFKSNGTKIINLYGPTEATVDVSYFDCCDENLLARQIITIGKPIDNIQLYIVDFTLQLSPVGVPGELCISGVGLARGYLNKPQLTNSKFQIPNKKVSQGQVHATMQYHSLSQYPITPLPHYPIYMTGDLARWLPDGNIEFLGRIDRQIKIRGFRIEPGEIENRLLNHKNVKEALVVEKVGAGGDKFLCAYLVPHSGETFRGSILREYLSLELPEYMVPAYFVPLERMPLNPSGKVDLNKLPMPELKATETYTAPRNETEEKLSVIWSEILGIEKDSIGIDSNFFELGGHSLKATTLVSKIHREFDVRIPLNEIFDQPTIKGIARYLGGAVKDKFGSIEDAEKKDYYSLSSAQKRLFFLQQMKPDQTAYNMSNGILLEGNFEIKKMEEAFNKLIMRHESLRTSFTMIDGNPVQKIADSVDFRIESYHLLSDYKRQMIEEGEISLTGDSLNDTKSIAIATEIIQQFIKPFDLSRPPLIKVGFIQLQHMKYLLIFDMHHIISDGISLTIFITEFMTFYEGKELSPLKIQYKDYSEWQNCEKGKKRHIKQEEYWLKEFEGDIPMLHLPTDYTRPLFQDFEGNRVVFTISEKDTQGLSKLALEEGTTLYTVLISIYYVLMFKLSRQEDIVVGAPTAGRLNVDIQDLIGIFINILAFRNFPGNQKSFREFLGEVKDRSLEAYDNQEYSFEDLVDKLKFNRYSNRNPLFDVMFLMQNQETIELKIPGLKLKFFMFEPNISKFDLSLQVMERDGKLNFILEYSTRLFKRETIDVFILYYKNILSSVLEGPYSGRKIADIEIIPAGKRTALLEHLNSDLEEEAKSIMYGSRVLQDKLIESFNKFKDHTAVEYDDKIITYAELERRSNYIANWLDNKGIKRGNFIGILIENRMELIIPIVGIVKAGCVFIPLDPAYPGSRLELMIDVINARLILTDMANIKRFRVNTTPGNENDNRDREFIPMGEIFIEGEPSWFTHKPAVQYHPEDKAYIYFTSGTTGVPKAILGKNRSLLHFINWEIGAFNFSDDFRITQFTTPSFDPYLRDIFVSLCSGGVICIPREKELILNADELKNWIDKLSINVIRCVPGIFRLLTSIPLNEDNFKALKLVLLSGEKTNPSDLEVWYRVFDEKVQLVNLYGPTETTLIKAFYFINKDDVKRERIPIGKPIEGSRLVILDENLNVCGPMIKGEICIRTPFISYGYCNDPLLNKKKFIRNPFVKGGEDILYRSGDLGRVLADGNIDILGRIDRQVKLRGHRIEPEGIENVLISHPRVKEAAVVKKEMSTNNELLCAYVVENSRNVPGKISFISDIKTFLLSKLPPFMVPAVIINIEKMPRNPNGKIDYKAFPDPVKEEETRFQPPRDEVEKKLIDIWCEVLGLAGDTLGASPGNVSIGVGSNCFELGANSLNFMTLISRIHWEFDVRIPLGDLFNNPIIKKQAGLIKEARKEGYISIKPVEKREYYHLSSAQKRLYILQHIELKSTFYNMYYVLTVGGNIDKGKLETALTKLLDRHESLRTGFETVKHEPVQKIYDDAGLKIEHFYLNSDEHIKMIIKNFKRPFDLSIPPLMRIGLIECVEERYVLLVDVHHIIADVVSIGVFTNEFMELYSGKDLPRLKLQYKDYSEWQNRSLDSPATKKQEEYWLKQFKGNIPAVLLPTDYEKPAAVNFDGDLLTFEIDESLTAGIMKVASETETTLFMLLLAVYNILLFQYKEQSDIIIGSPVAGRTYGGLQNIIGMFVNMLVLRNFPGKNKRFADFLMEVKENTLRAYENQDYQFEQLVKKLGLKREPSGNPLINTIFTLQNAGTLDFGDPKYNRSGLDIKIDPYEKNTVKFDLTLDAMEKNNSINMWFTYSTARFMKSTIQRLKQHLIEILEQVVQNIAIKIKDISLSYDFVLTKSSLLQEDTGEFDFRH